MHPAPLGTFVWGQQHLPTQPPQQALRQEEFPALPGPSRPTQAPASPLQASPRRQVRATAATQTPPATPPPQPCTPPGTVVVPVEVFREFAEELTKGLTCLFTRHSGGKLDIPAPRVDEFVTRVVDQVLQRVQVLTAPPPTQIPALTTEPPSSTPATMASPSANGIV